MIITNSLTETVLLALGVNTEWIGTDSDYNLIRAAAQRATAAQREQAITAAGYWAGRGTAEQKRAAAETQEWVRA